MFRAIFYIIGSLGGVAVIAVSVTPQDAVTNVVAWAEFLGITDLPDFMSSASADIWVFWFGLSAVILALVILFWPRVKRYFPNWIRIWKWDSVGVGIFPCRRLIPLQEAAQIAYERTQGTPTAEWAEEMDGGRVINWYARALTCSGEIPVYGKKPNSRIRREISFDELQNYVIKDDGKALWNILRTETAYVELSITRSDMKKRIKEITIKGSF